MRLFMVLLSVLTFGFSKLIYFKGGNMSLQDLTNIVSTETQSSIVLSSLLNDKKVYLIVNKVINTKKLLSYYKALLSANGLKLINKGSFYLVSPFTDRIFYSYRFKHRKSNDFKPFMSPLKKYCFLGNDMLVCDTIPKNIDFVKKLIFSFDKSLPYDKFLNYTVSIHVKVLESNYNALKNLSNHFVNTYKTNNLQTLVNSGKNGLSLSSLLFFNGVSVVNNMSFNYLFNYLQTMGISTVLNEPNILVSNNNKTTIISGGKQKVIASVTKSSKVQSQTTTNYTDFTTGIFLSVKVHIIDDKKVKIILKFNNENVVGGTPLLPLTSKQSYNTTLIVNKNSSIVLGGVIYDKSSKINTKVPFLGDIPILGFPFRSSHKVFQKKVLSLVLTVKDILK